MNRVPLSRRVQIINALVEGNSIRSTERMTGTHRDTICRLLVEVGAGCAQLMVEQMRGLACRRIQVDEIWAYVGKKQAHLKCGDDRSRLGDMWTFVAISATSAAMAHYRTVDQNRKGDQPPGRSDSAGARVASGTIAVATARGRRDAGELGQPRSIPRVWPLRTACTLRQPAP